MEDFSQVSWLAVGVGTIAAFLVGWLWYSPKLFGTKWAEGSGVEMGSASSMPVFPMVSQLVALFLLSMVVGITATAEALITAILAILAVATFVVSTGSFGQKSMAAVTIDFFYIVVAGVVMIICQGIF